MSEASLGKIQVYTGHGKGKTTASLGLAMRAIGAGKRVGLIFFDKGGEEYSERKVLERFTAEELEYHVFGRDRRDETKTKFDFSIKTEDISQMKKAMEMARIMANEGKFDVLILDEINSVTSLGMLEVSEVLDFLKAKPFYLELIFTGRDCPESIIEQADLVTEMREVKHYFKDGTKAREGIDY